MSTLDRRGFFQAVGTGMSAAALLQAAETAYPNRKALVLARESKGIVAPNKTYRMMEWECHTPPEANFRVDLDGNERSYQFFQDILSEVMDLFPGEFIHLGGDEVPKAAWKECARCQARMKAEGLTDENELQSY